MRREMTKAHQAECIALTRDIRALLVERQVSPPMTQVVLINTLVAMIKNLGRKDTMEEARRIWFARCNGRSRSLNKPQPVRSAMKARPDPDLMDAQATWHHGVHHI